MVSHTMSSWMTQFVPHVERWVSRPFCHAWCGPVGFTYLLLTLARISHSHFVCTVMSISSLNFPERLSYRVTEDAIVVCYRFEQNSIEWSLEFVCNSCTDTVWSLHFVGKAPMSYRGWRISALTGYIINEADHDKPLVLRLQQPQLTTGWICGGMDVKTAEDVDCLLRSVFSGGSLAWAVEMVRTMNPTINGPTTEAAGAVESPLADTATTAD